MKHRALASLALVLASGLVALRASASRASEARAVIASAPQRASASEPVHLAPVADAHPGVVAVAPVEPATPSAGERPERIDRAVRELALLLVAEPFDRAGLERAAEALARPLAPPEVEALAAGLGSADGSPAQHLATCELLRVRDPRPGTLNDARGAELRELARQSGLAALPESAARALVALGGTADVRYLIGLLCDEDPSVRSRCTRALTGATDLPEPARVALVPELELALADASEPASRALERALRALRPPVEDPEAATRALLAPETSDSERLLAAADLARAPQVLAPETHAAARALLEQRAADGSPSERRRALYALGVLADPSTLPTLVQAARSDPDPAARSAGVRALRGFEAHATLEAVAASDPSPAVRALAVQELERSAPAQSPGPGSSAGGVAGASPSAGAGASGSITKSVLAGPMRSPRK